MLYNFVVLILATSESGAYVCVYVYYMCVWSHVHWSMFMASDSKFLMLAINDKHS